MPFHSSFQYDASLLPALLSLALISSALLCIAQLYVQKDKGPANVDPQAYRYNSINPHEEIRIVELLPGNLHTPIELKITKKNLLEITEKNQNGEEQKAKKQKAGYEALSYTWGDHSSKVSISVKVGTKGQTRSIKVTRNLSMALRHLRRPSEPMMLWIDALCINQEDIEEKTHQVSMMTEIYKKADLVRIWLGPEANDSDLAMKTLARRVDHTLSGYLMDEKNDRVRRALEALPTRDYWTRVWVVQEILVAQSIKIHCGQLEVDWDSAAEVFPEVLKARSDLLARNMSPSSNRRASSPRSRTSSSRRPYHSQRRHPRNTSPSSPHRAPLPKGREHSPRRRTLTALPTTSTFGPSPGTWDMRTSPIQNVGRLAKGRSPDSKRGSWWLFNMLLEHRHYGATDERDKIFSMLGLLDRSLPQNKVQIESAGLHVKYDLSFLDISTRLFKYLVLYPPKKEAPNDDEKRLLNVVCASQPNTNPGFPTWLPDFSRDNGMKPWPLGEKSGRPVYFEAHAELSDVKRTLSIQGAEIGTITAVTDNQDDCQATDDLSLLARLGYFLRLIPESFQSTGHVWKSLILGEGTGKRLVKALPKKIPIENSRILEDFEAVVKNGSDQSSHKLTLRNAYYPKILRGFLNEFRSKSYRRRFAVLKRSIEHKRPKDDEPTEGDVTEDDAEKLMAMVPEDAKEGDSLYQLGSCEYWVLLRPIVTEVSCFHFVGPVYLAETPSWLKCNKTTPKRISLN